MGNMRTVLGDYPDSHGHFVNLFDTEQFKKLDAVCHEYMDQPVAVPTNDQLTMTFWAGVIPFLGFGFLDNALMILFGDVIDQSFCVVFGFSTLAAAALGNTISDFFGVFSGGAVEDLAQSAGFKVPEISPGQRQLRITRTATAAGNSVGIIIGCLLGMAPLIWMDADAANRKKNEERRKRVILRAVEYLPDLLDAEAAVIMMVDPDRSDELHSIGEGNLPSFRSDRSVGVMGQVSRTGKFMNIPDIKNSEFYNPARHEQYQGTELGVESVLCMPIMDLEDNVMGVVELINKEGGGKFTEHDEAALSAFCSHIAVQFFPDEQSFESILGFVRNQMTLPEGKSDKAYHSKQVDSLYEEVVKEVSKVLDVEAAALLLLETDPQTGDLELVTRATTDNLEPFKWPTNYGVLGAVCTGGKAISANDFQNTEWFDRNRHLNYRDTGICVREMLAVPMFDVNGSILGVLEVINKKNIGAGFNQKDLRMLTAVSSHISLTVQGPGSSLRQILHMVKQQTESSDGELNVLHGSFASIK